jgi:drug/metabolite transporter (DMT)-like permease
MVDRLLGWKVDVAHVNHADALSPYWVDLHRSRSTVAFGVVILGVLIALAGVALFVAVQTARDRRKFQPPMTTWYAAMLFAVMPLRNALPDPPPFGSWIDVTIVLWVVVVLVISMVIYISCWWRHLRPEVDKPT